MRRQQLEANCCDICYCLTSNRCIMECYISRLQLILASKMDNCYIQFSAFCCLLPLIASVLMLVHSFSNFSPHLKHKDSSSEQLHEFRFAQTGLILARKQKDDQQVPNRSPKQQKRRFSKHRYLLKSPNTYHNYAKQQNSRLGCKVLGVCNMGLAKMNFINKAYFRKNNVEDCVKNIEERSKKKIYSKTIGRQFEPTCLVTIVEGLQY